MAKAKLMIIIYTKAKFKFSTNPKLRLPKILSKRPKTTAIKRLIPGPAKATLAAPYFLSEKNTGLMGTGLAYPTGGRFIIPRIIGSKIVPKGSI